MCHSCGPETIHHVLGERPVSREWCYCHCHDGGDEDGNTQGGAVRDDPAAAFMACDGCRWAHVVAFSTADWRSDERYMHPPRRPTHADPAGGVR